MVKDGDGITRLLVMLVLFSLVHPTNPTSRVSQHNGGSYLKHPQLSTPSRVLQYILGDRSPVCPPSLNPGHGISQVLALFSLVLVCASGLELELELGIDTQDMPRFVLAAPRAMALMIQGRSAS